ALAPVANEPNVGTTTVQNPSLRAIISSTFVPYQGVATEMTRAYAPKTFLRQCPNDALKAYFDAKGIPIEIDWQSLTPRKIDPLFEATEGLPDNLRQRVDRDFRLVFEMATDKGRLLIIEQADVLGIELGDRVADGENAYA